LVSDQNTMAQADVLHRARQYGRVARGAMTVSGQPTCDLLIGLPLPCQRQDRLLHLLATRAALQGAHGDCDRRVRRITSFPDDTTGDLIRGGAVKDDLVDQTAQERLLLLP